MYRLFVGIAVAMALNTMLCAQTFSEEDFRIRGYVDIHSLDTTIRLALIYSTTDNFVGEDMYGDFDKAYFEKGFAERIRQAQTATQRISGLFSTHLRRIPSHQHTEAYVHPREGNFQGCLCGQRKQRREA